MTITCSVFIGTSLDGFIARPDGDIEWLNQANAVVPPGEDCGYKAFMASVDTLVMGRKTYEKVLTFGEWPYGDTPVVVLSRGASPLQPGAPETVTSSREEPGELVERLAAEGRRHLYVDGGITVQSFLAAGLIDTITITVVPVLLGAGITLFGPLSADLQLAHVATRAYAFGFVQSTYRVLRDGHVQDGNDG